MSDFPTLTPDETALLKLDKAHAAYEGACDAMEAEIRAAVEQVKQKHMYFIHTATSVLYEALANASREGFTERQMADAMECDGH